MLDSTAVVRYLRGDLGVQAKLDAVRLRFLPLAALGELLFGVERAANKERSAAKVDALVARCCLLYPNTETAKGYAQIKAQLWSEGHPIPENDIWIAATAKQARLPLAARDEHFDFVEGLEVFHI